MHILAGLVLVSVIIVLAVLLKRGQRTAQRPATITTVEEVAKNEPLKLN